VRTVLHSARTALLDLLAYRRAFDVPLAGLHRYGLVVAWGGELKPNAAEEIMLCTQGQNHAAIGVFAA
jgi:hypothetical protein